LDQLSSLSPTMRLAAHDALEAMRECRRRCNWYSKSVYRYVHTSVQLGLGDVDSLFTQLAALFMTHPDAQRVSWRIWQQGNSDYDSKGHNLRRLRKCTRLFVSLAAGRADVEGSTTYLTRLLVHLRLQQRTLYGETRVMRRALGFVDEYMEALGTTYELLCTLTSSPDAPRLGRTWLLQTMARFHQDLAADQTDILADEDAPPTTLTRTAPLVLSAARAIDPTCPDLDAALKLADSLEKPKKSRLRKKDAGEKGDTVTTKPTPAGTTAPLTAAAPAPAQTVPAQTVPAQTVPAQTVPTPITAPTHAAAHAPHHPIAVAMSQGVHPQSGVSLAQHSVPVVGYGATQPGTFGAFALSQMYGSSLGATVPMSNHPMAMLPGMPAGFMLPIPGSVATQPNFQLPPRDGPAGPPSQ